MAVYAIGDIQGCFEPLQRLIDQIAFDPAADRLWFVGDLVNRGPESLAVLRWVKSLGKSAVVVLGNHDLHLLAVASGVIKPRREDPLQEVLDAPDREELLEWLRRRPLLYREQGFLLVHAGLLPQWSIEEAERIARDIEAALQTDAHRFLRRLYGRESGAESNGLARLCDAASVLTRLRVCTPAGRPDYSYTGPPFPAPPGLVPWFAAPNRRNAGNTIVCGHWAALGLRMEPNLIAIDTGCIWGGRLTAVRLEDRQLFQTPCPRLGPSGKKVASH